MADGESATLNVMCSMFSTTPSGRGELLIQQGELAGRNYRFEAIVCQNPTCDCERVTLKCFTEMPTARTPAPIPLYLKMDLERLQLADLGDINDNPATRSLPNSAA